MNIKSLLDVPPWEWPADAGKTLHQALIDPRTKASDRLAAAELGGDLTVMNNEMADALLNIVRSADQPEKLRATAAIALGAVLEEADIGGFEDPDDVSISERKFHEIQDSLHKLCLDDKVPKEVRRRILEASVRAPRGWHREVIKTAYASGDRDWMLTAVFSMRYVRGFDDLILEALESADPDIHYEAVSAAGGWELDGAWSHVVALVEAPATPKPLLLAAIEAVGNIRPDEAGVVLDDLMDSDDEEIAEAVDEAIAMANARSEAEDEEEDEEDAKE